MCPSPSQHRRAERPLGDRGADAALAQPVGGGRPAVAGGDGIVLAHGMPTGAHRRFVR